MLAQRNFRESHEPGYENFVGVKETQCEVLCSYLLIDFHRFLGVIEKELFTRRGQVYIYLEAGILREFPAVWTTAEGAIKCFCDGCIQ